MLIPTYAILYLLYCLHRARPKELSKRIFKTILYQLISIAVFDAQTDAVHGASQCSSPRGSAVAGTLRSEGGEAATAGLRVRQEKLACADCASLHICIKFLGFLRIHK